MATVNIYHIQAGDFLQGNIDALNADALCDRLAYLPTVNFDKACTFPLQWRMDDQDILDEAFSVTNQMSSHKDLNDWFKVIQTNHNFHSGSAGDLYIIKEIDSDHRGYLALPFGWQKIRIQPIEHMLKDAVRYNSLVTF